MTARSGLPPRLGPDDVAAVSRLLVASRPPAGAAPFVATEAELAAVQALSRACFGPQALSRRELSFYLRRAHALILGLRRGGDLAAHTVVELNRGQRRVYIVETCTAQAQRGRGHASWLRARVEDIAARLGYRHITSHVSVDNLAALAMNRKAGLDVVRRVDGYYEDGGDALYLRKTLGG